MVNEIVKGKRTITPDTAAALGAAFEQEPTLWLGREAAYQVAHADVDTAEVRRCADLYKLAPIKEMERRGWLRAGAKIDELEGELNNFLGDES